MDICASGYRSGRRSHVDENGDCKTSFENYAVAMIDEVEIPQHIGKRFTLEY